MTAHVRLAASCPLIALFFAMGMSNRIGHAKWTALALTVIAKSLPRTNCDGRVFICVPWMAHHFSPIGTMVQRNPTRKQGEAFVFGGRRMSGFLVVPDEQPLRDDVPSLHLADFEAIVRQSGVELYQDLIHPTLPPLPFGFVFAPRVEKGTATAFPCTSCRQRSLNAATFPAWHFRPASMGVQTEWLRRVLVLRHQGGTLALIRDQGRQCVPYFPRTSPATSTASFSLAHCFSSVRTLPSSVEAKPHCGDSAS